MTMYPHTTLERITHMNNQERTKNRRGLAVGLTAGLIGGTAAGLVLGVPGLSGAADSAVDGSAVGLVQQVDDPAPADDVTDVAPQREPGARIVEMLQPLVDEGTITTDQAQAVADHMVENRPDRGDRPGRGGRGHGKFGGEVVTELLGIDAEALRAELQGGATLVEVAGANGVSEAELVAALVAHQTERIDQAVVDGKLTAEEAAEKTADVEERITARVNGERPERPSTDDAGN
ncbi:MAG: hypothetical protein ACR2O6_15110 [Ilumatobacteraceae bacterium]